MNAEALDADAIKARHAAFFVPNWRARAFTVAIVGAIATL
jgi:hypothetical protein